ncbi:DUF1801 domain-containing protein [Elizabethkingia anophelis]|uniref:YdhG-like domain-containing protein n=1 Tax=Elizabethkingia anophelis R26 TaxID=1246994 RepID=A0ABN5C4U2_9FLAO|nr:MULTISPECIES: DUF1801 domain-containing protein [Elizabethkingia]ATC38272.1 hypothetical protein BAZ09_014335 [Elizabethkingia anophelis R26]ATC41954.1 hypothetical protein EAAG1_014550 [Elizabethkingia anophelis Ag1]ATC45634.1 hypothetical protein CMV41_14550 [Elizabethkingia anophelis]ATC49310.1 hypothetical protein CMV40_14550 [Elizabethkingia anophelis]EGT4347102.1 DUF1801 domain-containing protein [Elizabethkingia anophelis]
MSNLIQTYLEKVPDERKMAFEKLFNAIDDNLPTGFELTEAYGMLTWVVPLSSYPAGYHCAPGTPLPFLSLASQKNFLAFYHMGIYADKDLLEWFQESYTQHAKYKLDMGKSCVRFKKMDDIPYGIIAELSTKISPEMWIEKYETVFKK